MVWSSRKLERKPKPCGVYKEHSRRLQDIGTPQSAQNQHCERGEPSEGCNVVRFPTGVKPKGAIRWHCRARILAAHSACPQAERLIRRRRTYPKMSSFRSAFRHDRELRSTEKPVYSNCCNKRLLFSSATHSRRHNHAHTRSLTQTWTVRHMISTDPNDPGFLRLSYRHAAIAVEIRALALSLRVKAGFRADQPRVPAGNPDGGWIIRSSRRTW